MFFISSFVSLGFSYFIYYCMTAQRDYASLLLASPPVSHTHRERPCASLWLGLFPPIDFLLQLSSALLILQPVMRYAFAGLLGLGQGQYRGLS